jgi:transposase-like protein
MARHEESTASEQPSVFDLVLQSLPAHGLGAMSEAIRVIVNEAMRLEREEFLGAAAYERTEARRGQANGFKPKKVATRLGDLTFAVPQVRQAIDGQRFYPSALERGVRSERALKLAIAEMYVQGVSTRKVTQIVEELCGHEVTSTDVSRAAALLDGELNAWRNRPLDRFDHLLLDARYEKVRHGGSVVSCAVLIAIGIDPDGRRAVLGCSVSLSEAEVHWRSFLESLQSRGLHGVKLIVSDNHAGLRAALEARLAGVPWQRCQFHLQQNAQGYVPRISMRREVAEAIRGIFNAGDRPEAERLLAKAVENYRDSAPELSRWMEANIPDGFTVFAFPAAQRKRLRTVNLLEGLNKELRRRTRVATLFPNEASLLRLVSAVLAERSEEWETGKIYLPRVTN